MPNLLRQSPLFPQVYTDVSADVVRMQQSALKALEARVAAVTGRDPSAFRIVVDTGGPDAGIIRVADEVRATLVVVASRGATGLDRLLLGSVAERVVRYAHCPVLVARPHDKTGRVLAATDFSEAAGPAIEVAAQEARRRGTRLTLLHSLDILPAPPSAGVSPSARAGSSRPRRSSIRRRPAPRRRSRPRSSASGSRAT